MAGTSWPSLVAGARAKASEVESKFDWIEQDLVPMAGGSKADATYDLGQSTFRWRDIYYSRQILSPNGSAATPPDSWINSPTSGFYRAGSNNVGFAAAGVQAWSMNSGGEQTLPLQPSFFSFIDSAGSVLNTTTATITSFTREIVDRGNDFSDSVFTAPITGIYQLGAQVSTNQSSGSFILTLITNSYTFFNQESFVTGSVLSPQIHILLPMTSGDRAYLARQNTVIATGTALLLGYGPTSSSMIRSFFYGYLFA